MAVRLRQWGKTLLRKAGFHTSRKIVVFESDDWGSVRAPSVDAVCEYKRRYPDQKLDHYQLYDGIESAQDIRALVQVLSSHETKDGHVPCFTLNYAMANPVFSPSDVLESQGFRFSYEPIQKTYMQYWPGVESPIDVLKDHTVAAVAKPQLHAREHLNATQWTRGIQRFEHLAYAYSLGMIGLDPDPYNAMDALNKSNTFVDRGMFLREACELFQDAFGFAPTSFIPPCYVIDNECLSVLAELGVTTVQGGIVVNISRPNGSLFQRINYTGKRTPYGQVNLSRNCYFEPVKYFHQGLSVDKCIEGTLAEIEKAFDSGQAAIVCTHRVNYTSTIVPKCRDYSLEGLGKLLDLLQKKHPIVEYLTSDELGAVIAASKR